MRILVLLMLLCLPLDAQSFDRERSRFVTQDQGRAGCYAPFEVFVQGGGDSVEIISFAPGIEMVYALALDGGNGRALVPVYVGPGAGLRIAGTEDAAQELRPKPPRGVPASYERPYAAVFAPDPVGARAALPSRPGALACDYFDSRDFFTDWRLLDGYDALVIFNPGAGRLPPGAQRAIAEFCSLGGACFVAGSFQLGERAAEIPAPGEPESLTFAGVPVLRYGYGAGAVYRVEYASLREANARDVIEAALRDHLRFGATDAPGGMPPSRAVPPLPSPVAAPEPIESRPGLLFGALVSGLLLSLLLLPVVLRRIGRGAWCGLGALGVGGVVFAVAMLQAPPGTRLNAGLIEWAGAEAGVAATRGFVVPQAGGMRTLTLRLDTADRRLARPQAGGSGWIVDEPLTRPGTAGPAVTMQGGSVQGQMFRDFAMEARRGNTVFAAADGALLDWWLESNAMRGRDARLFSGKSAGGEIRYTGQVLSESAWIRVHNLRAKRD